MRRLSRSAFTRTVKAVPKISSKNQITVPVAALVEAGLNAGDRVVVEPAGDGELRVRRAAMTIETAFGALTGIYPEGNLERLDAEERSR